MPNLNSLLETQLAKMEVMITNYCDAIIALSAENGVISYSLDTGQGKQSVTRQDLATLKMTYDSLLNQYAVICSRLGRNGVNHGFPAF